MCGNTGSTQKFKYGPLGHAVNLASRLEGLNKHYGTEMLISDSTYQQVKDAVVARPLDWVSVKGKTEAVLVYELFGLNGEVDPGKEELATLYEFLDQAIMRHPEEKKGYDAMRGLTEKGIPGAAERFNAILMKVPLASANAAVGVDISTLVTQRPELKGTFEMSLNRLTSSVEKIGAAFKTTRKAKN